MATMMKHQRLLFIYKYRMLADIRLQGTGTLSARETPPAPLTTEQIVIDDIFLAYRDGRLISHHTRKLRPDRDDQVLTGMFTAVQEFISQSFGGDEETKIDEISYGGSRILIEHGKHVVIAAVVSGEGTRQMHGEMKAAVHNIEAEHGPALEKWSGDTKELKGTRRWVQMLVAGERIERVQPVAKPPEAETPVQHALPDRPPAPAMEHSPAQPSPPPPPPPAVKEVLQTPPVLPPGARPLPNPFPDETAALRTLSSLPRGLPSSLSGMNMEELAAALAAADFAETADGDTVVRLGKKWYYGDPKVVDTYLQPYRT